jgi:hypothetical protein
VTPPVAVEHVIDGRRPHLLRARWEADDRRTEASISFWLTSAGRIVLHDIRANADTRGRDMLRWLGGHGHAVDVVEVIPQAEGYWRLMKDEGLVASWQAATGRAHPWERIAVPFDGMARPAQTKPVGRWMGSGGTQGKRPVDADRPPAGYGATIQPDGGRPEWLDAGETVRIHMPSGVSERRAGQITTWRNPYRLRADHPHYQDQEAG